MEKILLPYGEDEMLLSIPEKFIKNLLLRKYKKTF